MSRVNRILSVLDNPTTPALMERTEDEEVLLTMMVHMFFADGIVADSELKVLQRLVGDKTDSELRAYLGELGGRHLDYSELATRFPDRQERDDIVTLAEHGIWGDNIVEPGEVDMLENLMEVLGIEPG